MAPTTSLPSPDQRWVASRKAALVAAIRAGQISLEEACRRYQLCPDEFDTWAAAIDKHGVPGLRATRFQIYRDNPRRQAMRDDATPTNMVARFGGA
jgi:hypothetical protein